MVILYTGVLLIIYSIISGKKYRPEFGFFFVFFIMAFQSNLEGDYIRYMDAFKFNEISRTAEDEPLWDIITKPFHFLGTFGWYVFVFCLSFFQYFVISRFFIRHTEGKFKFLGAILFFFTFGLMLIQMKAMRQGLAIELSLLPYLFNMKGKKHQWFYCFVPVVVAYLVHNSSLLALLPVSLYYIHLQTGIFNNNISHKRSEWFWPIVITAIFCIVYALRTTIFSDYFMNLGSMATMNDMRLGGYLEGNEVEEVFQVSYLIILYHAIIVFLTTWYYMHTHSLNRVFSIMTILAAFCDILFFGMGSLARIGYFFLVADIVVLTNVSNLLNNRVNRLSAFIFILFCISYAIKTSLPWLTSMDPERFGNYLFIFM